MKTELISAELSSISTELLVVLAWMPPRSKNHQAPNQEAKPEVRLLITDTAVSSAATAVTESGEYAAASAETVLLHAPAGLEAKRLLLVGLSKLNPLEIRKAVGVAVRFAQNRATCANCPLPCPAAKGSTLSLPFAPRSRAR